MFFGVPQTYLIDMYEFYFEEYMLGYLNSNFTGDMFYGTKNIHVDSDFRDGALPGPGMQYPA